MPPTCTPGNYPPLCVNKSIGGVGQLSKNVDKDFVFSYGVWGTRLSDLVPSAGTLQPSFQPGHSAYTLHVRYENTSITLTPLVSARAPNGTFAVIGGHVVKPGVPSPGIPLSMGTNAVPVLVSTEKQGVLPVYSLSIVREGQLALKSLVPSHGQLEPSFQLDHHTYQVTLPNSDDSITLTPTLSDHADPHAVLAVNDNQVTSGHASRPIYLSPGPNVITSTITNPSGDSGTYSVNAFRYATTTLAHLGLEVGGKSRAMSPVFAPSVLNYTAVLTSAESSTALQYQVTQYAPPSTVTVTSTTQGVAITESIQGGAQQIKSTSSENPVVTYTIDIQSPGTVANIDITITPDEGDPVVYKLAVTRQAETKLGSLTVTRGALTPAFDPAITSYTLETDSSSVDLTLSGIIPAASSATIGGVAVTAGSPHTINVTNGQTIDVVVSPNSGGPLRTYVLTVAEKALVLSNLSVKLADGTVVPIDPPFAATTTTYGAAVSNATVSVELTPTLATNAPTGATLTVDGHAATSGTSVTMGSLPLGNTAAKVVLSSQGFADSVYTVNVGRAGRTTLSKIEIKDTSGNVLYTDSSPSTSTQSVPTALVGNVSHVQLWPSLVDQSPAGAPTTIEYSLGTGAFAPVDNTAAVSISEGNNSLQFQVTAYDGTTATYPLNVYRTSEGDIVTLKASGQPGYTWNPTFSPDEKGYQVTIQGFDYHSTYWLATALNNDDVFGWEVTSSSAIPSPGTQGTSIRGTAAVVGHQSNSRETSYYVFRVGSTGPYYHVTLRKH